MYDPDLFGNPVGEKGRELLEEMNEHHRKLSEWALSLISDIGCERILDIGCGGGMQISLLADMFHDAEIYGIDISEDAVMMTQSLNSDIVKEGRCYVSQASVSDIPFDDGSFDLVTAFETYFFWPDLENDIKEVVSKVRNNGHLLIVSEAYPHPDFNELNDEASLLYGFTLRSNEDIASMLSAYGMNVRVNVIEEKNWVAFIGSKR